MSATVGLPVRKLHREMQQEMRAGDAQLMLPHLVEDTRSVAKNHGQRGDGIPHDIAETTQAGKIRVDHVPVGVECDILGSSDSEKALRRLRDRARVSDIELQLSTGCDWRA